MKHGSRRSLDATDGFRLESWWEDSFIEFGTRIMTIATYEGFIEDGKVRLPDNIHLPEKAKVYVIVPNGEVTSVATLKRPRLVRPEQADDFKKEVIQGINDAGI